MTKIKEAIFKAIQQIGLKPYDINNGECDRLTQIVCDSINGAGWRATEFEDEFEGYNWVGHVWIEYRGKHYDAECLEGVDNFLDLPIFQRSKRSNN